MTRKLFYMKAKFKLLQIKSNTYLKTKELRLILNAAISVEIYE